MKRIITLSSILLLSGCVNLTFDSTEFDHYLTIRELAESSTKLCGTSDFNVNLIVLKKDMDHQYNYSTLRGGGRPQIARAAKELKEMVDELYTRYETNLIPSIEYCEVKTNHISTGARIIVEELAKL